MDTQHEDDELVRRALAAWYRGGGTDAPAGGYVTELDGREYVVLTGPDAPLAVFRVRAFDGVLRRMRRWPKEVEAK